MTVVNSLMLDTQRLRRTAFFVNDTGILFHPLSANATKLSNTLQQFVGYIIDVRCPETLENNFFCERHWNTV